MNRETEIDNLLEQLNYLNPDTDLHDQVRIYDRLRELNYNF